MYAHVSAHLIKRGLMPVGTDGLSYSGPIFMTPGGQELVIDDGGALTIESGATVIVTLPTADPHVSGQLWNNAGVVKVSGG